MKKSSFRLVPFLSLNGRATEAIEFYKRHLGARVVFLKTNEDMKEYDPEYKFEETQAKCIAHSVLTIGENQIFISDEIMNGDSQLRVGNSMSLCIESASLETIEGIYRSLISEPGVRVVVPLDKNMFSPGYGSVEDPFGTLIQLSTEQ